MTSDEFRWRVVTTDGHRLSAAEGETPAAGEAPAEDAGGADDGDTSED